MSRRSLTAAAAALVAAALPAPALAAGTPAPRARIYLADAFSVGGGVVTVPHRVVHVTGVVSAYAPDQSVEAQLTVGGRLIETRSLRLARMAHSGWGEFKVAVASPRSGTLVIAVSHPATAGLGAFATRRRLAVLDPWVGFGARGRFVQLIQQRLAALRLYVPQTGVYDQSTGLAIDAYHRLLRWGTSQSLDGRTITALLDGAGSFPVRFPGHGRHAEGNLSLQLLALVDGTRVDAIYPISSGKPSTPTILGDFHVYLKVPGYLPDGMYYSNFFIRGYAIHGYDPAPDYPASHGCMRLPIADATSVYGWLEMGDWVDVYV